jgi:ribonuclease III
MTEERLRDITELEENFGWSFNDKTLLDKALTHRSYANENSAFSNADNEKLEFLGDAVLQLIISDLLMKKFPDYTEGQLSKLRASIVNERSLADLSRKFSVGKYLLLGKGEEASGGRKKPSLLANAFESVIAAMYLDGGFDHTRSLLGIIFEPFIEEGDYDSVYYDYKTAVQEKSMILFKTIPRYVLISETGPDHDKCFETSLFIGDRFIATGKGKSKKESEKQAARLATEILGGYNYASEGEDKKG